MTTISDLPTTAVRHRGRPAWRIVASVLAVAALLWGTLNVVNLLAHGEQRFTRTFAEPVTSVEVSTDRGSVRVIASDRDDISMSAYVSNGLGDTDHTERVRGNRLLIDASCTFPVAYWCTASYTLHVPRNVTLVLWSGSGDVSVSGRQRRRRPLLGHGACTRRGCAVESCTRARATGRSRSGSWSRRAGLGVVLARRRHRRRPAHRRRVPRRALDRSRVDQQRCADGSDRAPAGELSSDHGDVTARYPARLTRSGRRLRLSPVSTGGCPHPRDARLLHGIAAGISVPSNVPPHLSPDRSPQWPSPTKSSRPDRPASGCTRTPVVSARALVKTYGTGDAAVHALAGVDLDVAPAASPR